MRDENETFAICNAIQKNKPGNPHHITPTHEIIRLSRIAIRNYESAIKQDIANGMYFRDILKKWHIGIGYYKRLGGQTK